MSIRIDSAGSTIHLFVVAAALAIAGCATTPPDLPEHNPANPQATESGIELQSNMLADETTDAVKARLRRTPEAGGSDESPTMEGMAHGAQHQHEGMTAQETGEAAATNGSFTCPMHPEIKQQQPGACPKCGMKLVEKTKTP